MVVLAVQELETLLPVKLVLIMAVAVPADMTLMDFLVKPAVPGPRDM
jgi:hypothetical protein